MKKFRFRLEPILKLRAHAEKEKQKALAQAVQKTMAQEEYLTRLNENRRQTQGEQRHHLTGRLNQQMLLGYSRYFLKLKKNELAGRELLKVFEADREKKRLELVEATRRKKIFEKLKERRKETYHKELDLMTQKAQDEVASQTWQHKKSSPARGAFG